jgi:hypothetical protein
VVRCEVCGDEAAARAARVLHGLTETGRKDAGPSLDWARMATALRREAPAGWARRWTGHGAPALFTMAALVALGYLSLLRNQEGAPAQAGRSVRARVGQELAAAGSRPAAPAPVPAERARLTGVRWTLAKMAEPPSSEALEEGTLLVTGPGEALHVQLEEGTGFILAASSRLRLARLRAGEVELELLAGAVTSRVHELAASESYAVISGEHRVRVRGTRFRVALGGRGTEVDIDEGLVEIDTLAGTRIAELMAPGRWPSGAPAAGETVPEPSGPLADPHGYLQPVAGWPVVRLFGLERARQLQVGATHVERPGVLAMRVPPGDVELRAELADGRKLATKLHAEGGVLEVDARKLRSLVPADDPVRPAPVAPSVLGSVLHRSAPALQRCYDRSLLLHPTLEGRLRLRVRLDGSGHVASTEVQGAQAVPAELSSCFAQVTARWQFPEAAAGAELEVPLNLARSAK